MYIYRHTHRCICIDSLTPSSLPSYTFSFGVMLFFPLRYLTYVMQPLIFPYSRSSSLAIFLVSLLLVGDHGGARIVLPANVTVPAVIVFGDSIMDQGANNNLNTLVKANFAPYGKDFVNGKPTGRFSNNKTPADMFVEKLGIKELMPAYLDPSLEDKELLTGVSFASGGTGFDPQTSQIVGVLSFADQLNQFKEYIEKLKGIVEEERTQYILANSLFLVVAGSDDLANTYFTVGIRRLHYDIPSYSNLMVSSASKFIKTTKIIHGRTNWDSESDCYVVLKLGNQTAKTKVINSCLNPVWNEELTFSTVEPVQVLKMLY